MNQQGIVKELFGREEMILGSKIKMTKYYS
jgi:hypothetical protein